MRKGYDYLTISFTAAVMASFLSKIGAISLDIILFIFISYSLGSLFAFGRYQPTRKRIDKKTKQTSLKFGIIIGAVNFVAYFTVLSALAIGPGALIFPLLGLNMMAIVVLSMIIFKERLNWKGVLGFTLALIALFLLR